MKITDQDKYQVIRGAAWCYGVGYCPTNNMNMWNALGRVGSLGFRVVYKKESPPRILHGGGWYYHEYGSCVDYRSGSYPAGIYDDIGFRFIKKGANDE